MNATCAPPSPRPMMRVAVRQRRFADGEVVIRVVAQRRVDERVAVVLQQRVVGELLPACGPRARRSRPGCRPCPACSSADCRSGTSAPHARRWNSGKVLPFFGSSRQDRRAHRRIAHARARAPPAADARSTCRSACRRTGSGCRSAPAARRSRAAPPPGGSARPSRAASSACASRSRHTSGRAWRCVSVNTAGRPQASTTRRIMANSA